MSIYASGNTIGTPTDEDGEVAGEYPFGVVRTRDGWDSRGTNTYPTDASGLHAEIGVDLIPAYCVPGHRDDGEDMTGWGDRCRLSIAVGDSPESAMIQGPAGQLILDRKAARCLADELHRWATGATVSPDFGELAGKASGAAGEGLHDDGVRPVGGNAQDHGTNDAAVHRTTNAQERPDETLARLLRDMSNERQGFADSLVDDTAQVLHIHGISIEQFEAALNDPQEALAIVLKIVGDDPQARAQILEGYAKGVQRLSAERSTRRA